MYDQSKCKHVFCFVSCEIDFSIIYLTSTTKIMLGLFQLPFGGPKIEGILLVFLIRRPAKLTTTAV